MKALLVCHAGPGIGLGHVSRTLVIAGLLSQELGCEIQIIVQGDLVDLPGLRAYEHLFVPLSANLSQVLWRQLGKTTIGIVVFDIHHQHVPDNFESLCSRFRAEGVSVVGIDDLARYSHVLDLIYIPSFQYDVPDGADTTRFVYGWDAYLLSCSLTPVDWKPGNSVLVLTGGSDATGLGTNLPAELDARLSRRTEVNWVVGPYAMPPLLPVSPRHVFHLHYAPSQLDELMVSTHYAVTVFGVSFFELLYYGIPTVVFSPYGVKDCAALQGIDDAGVAVIAADEQDAIAKLMELQDDQERAARMSVKAQEVVRQTSPHLFVQRVQQLFST